MSIFESCYTFASETNNNMTMKPSVKKNIPAIVALFLLIVLAACACEKYQEPQQVQATDQIMTRSTVSRNIIK